EDTPVTFTVDVADVDSETLTVSVVEDSAVRGVATVDNKYEVTFVPDPDWHGDSAVDVIVSDGDLSSEALTVPILVTSVNDHPVLTVPAFELDEDSETTVTVNVTDVEDDWAERVLNVEITSGPGKGTLEADGKTFTYTGNADANGSDTFLLSVTDFDGAVAEVLVPVLINPVNDVPTHAQCDDVSVESGSEIAIDVALCGADIDGDVLTVADDAMVSNNGTAVIEDGMIVFAPADGYIGRTAVGFFLTDGTDSVETSIAIQVTEKVNPYIGTAGKDGQLVRIYSAMLGRLPDSKGFTYWSGQLEDGMTVQQLIRYFGTSDEFLNTYGDRLVSDSDADWIEFVYTEILERPSDAKGRAYWTDQLAGGLSRADMVTFFAESSEYKTQTQTL
ncbi:MAG: tandem-95 repeat protein, partial [Acidimicrobiales bacterium]|nr:tandem-95 repeat protein [Acidimicrobiales bacterium]